jgi:UDP-2-acetamido-2-deoxy-ribo-hexuluronate aminotransferase
MDIMPDLDIVLDYLIPERPGHTLAQKYIKPDAPSTRIWIAASMIDRLYSEAMAEGEKRNTQRAELTTAFSTFMSQVSILTVTAQSARDIVSYEHVAGDLAFRNFKRVAPNGIVLTSGEGPGRYPNTVSLAQFAGQPLKESPSVPMLDLKEEYRYMLEDIDESVLQCIADTRYILGPAVTALEKRVGEYLGVKHCIGASSGTDALVIALRALAIIRKGEEYFNRSDEIITTPLTFTATGDAILRAGATPVFVDIDPRTFNLDVSKIKDYLARSRGSVVGIMPVHLYGQACPMDDIATLASEQGLFVLEDVAQAFGGSFKGKKLGSIGTGGAFSFFPSKNLGSFGDGGMVACNDDVFAELVRMLTKHGGKDKYNVDHIGYNARLDTLQAAVILTKMKYVDIFNARRRELAGQYQDGLQAIQRLVLPAADEGHVFHQYTVRVLNGRRDTLQKHLQSQGIGSMIYYPLPLHKMKVFENRMKVPEPVRHAEAACAEVLSLPVEPLQSRETTDCVIRSVRNFFKETASC